MEVKLLRDYVRRGCRLTLSFAYCTQSQKESAWLEVMNFNWHGQVNLDSISHCQKFYTTNQQLIELEASKINDKLPAGKRLVKLRDLVFIDSQLYVMDGPAVLRMAEENGFTLLRVTDKMYRSVLAQLHKGCPQWIDDSDLHSVLTPWRRKQNPQRVVLSNE